MAALLIDYVLFDLDGTLVDSTPSVRRNWARVAAMIGRPGEDAPAGISAAHAAGCRALGVLTTFTSLDADTVADLTVVTARTTADGLAITYPGPPA